jgi:hypothetical protein
MTLQDFYSMKKKIMWTFAFALLTACVQAEDCVKVSQFGFSPEDSTRFVQAALDSGAKKVVFDRQAGAWIVTPVFARSNTEIIFEEGVELLAKRGEFKTKRDSCLLNFVCVTNVTLRGIGKGGKLRMWIKDYHSKAYLRSEWRHALNILSSSNVTVEKMAFVESGGDGIYLGEKGHDRPNRDIVIRDCVCDANNRQGISVITVDGLLIERTVLSNTYGTNPKAGIDFEPNSAHQKLKRIVLRDCLSKGNHGKGYEFYMAQFSGKTEPVDVVIENCRSIDNRRGGISFAMGRIDPGRTVPQGKITVRNCSFESSPSSGISFSNKTIDSPYVILENCTVINSPLDPTSKSRPVSFSTRTFWTPPTDGIELRNLTVIPSGVGEWCSIKPIEFLKEVEKISGEVHIKQSGKASTVNIDQKWCKENFRQKENKADLRVTPFDYTRDWEIVDGAPGKMVKFENFRLRDKGKAIVYASSKREVSLEGRLIPISRKSKKQSKVGSFVVRDMKGRRVASVKMFDAKKCVRRFRLPAKGFYSIEWNVDRQSFCFSACDAPLALAPTRDGVNIFRAIGTFYIPHRAGATDTVVCGGGGGECANVTLIAPSGKVAASWDSLGSWAFKRLDEEGLWKLSFAKPSEGMFEDTFVTVVGDSPSLLFLTSEKYWK